MATQNQLDTDTFGGTAGTALHTYNANWVNSVFNSNWFDPKLSTPNGGVVFSSTPSGSERTGQTWTNDQYAQATLAIIGADKATAIGVRLGDNGSGAVNSGYFVGPNFEIAGNAYRVYSVAAGFNAPLATSSTLAIIGDVVNIQIVGSLITVRVNGSIISDLTTTDSNHTTGNPGLFISDATGKWTTWSAGSVTAGGGTARNGMLLGIAP